jgi:hypothetical protein
MIAAIAFPSTCADQILRSDYDLILRSRSVGWGKRTSPSDHILSDRGLADLDAQLEQTIMDPRRIPERVGAAHLPNQITNLPMHRRPPGSRTPTPNSRNP